MGFAGEAFVIVELGAKSEAAGVVVARFAVGKNVGLAATDLYKAAVTILWMTYFSLSRMSTSILEWILAIISIRFSFTRSLKWV